MIGADPSPLDTDVAGQRIDPDLIVQREVAADQHLPPRFHTGKTTSSMHSS
jgi:hypothetical protein